MSSLLAIGHTIRPRQWVKNVFTLAPLVFSKHLLELSYSLRALAAFAIFCALSGAVYAFNDVMDVESDRRHPTKRHRPIAAGVLPTRTALLFSFVVANAALASATLISPWLALVAAGYLANNLLYSLALKRFAYVDVLLISGGFLLRVIAGGYAIGVPVSSWLLVCTALLSCFLGFGKRVHELQQAIGQKRAQRETRKALDGYSVSSLRFALLILAIGTCAAYALYTRDTHTIDAFHTDRLAWTLPFCIAGISRFLQITLWMPSEESPTDVILHDWPFLLNLIAWATTVVSIIYLM